MAQPCHGCTGARGRNQPVIAVIRSLCWRFIGSETSLWKAIPEDATMPGAAREDARCARPGLAEQHGPGKAEFSGNVLTSGLVMPESAAKGHQTSDSTGDYYEPGPHDHRRS